MAGFLDTLFGGGAEQEAADKNRQLLAAYQPQTMGYLKEAYGQGRGDLGQAVQAYQPLANIGQQFGGANQMLLNAYGLGGPQGTADAQAAFQAGPGYQWAMDQGMEARKRAMAGSSMGQSGNSEIDAIKFGQGLANQEYNPWRTGLQGLGQMGIQAAGMAGQGQSQGYTNLANLAQTYGTNQAGVAGNVLSGNMDANKLQAAGEAAGAKNVLGFGMNLASLAAGGMGGGGLGSLLGGAAGSIPGAAGPTSVGGAPLKSPGLFGSLFG